MTFVGSSMVIKVPHIIVWISIYIGSVLFACAYSTQILAESHISNQQAAIINPQNVSGIEPLAIIGGHGLDIIDIASSPDGKTITTASLDNTATIWDMETQCPLHTLLIYPDTVTYSPNGENVMFMDRAKRSQMN